MKKFTYLFFMIISIVMASCHYNTIEFETPDIDPDQVIRFKTDIEPIFETQNCTSCHNGAITFSLSAGKAYQSIIGEQLIDPADPEASLLLTVPGHDSHQPYTYTPHEKALIQQWIEQGGQNN